MGNINFSQTTNVSASDLGYFAAANLDDDPAEPGVVLGAHSYPGAGTVPSGPRVGDGIGLSVLNAGLIKSTETGGGGVALSVTLHEIGHGLGLGHPQDTGGGSTQQLSGTVLDNEKYTVMSYNFATTAATLGHAVSYMALDIAALQHLYGVDNTAHTGATTYMLRDAGAAALDTDGSGGSVSIGRAYYGIWDASGTDNISYSGNSRALINLNDATLKSTLDSGADAALISLLATVGSSSAFGGLSATVQNEMMDSSRTAGGFFSQVLDAGGNAIDGGYTIANGAVIENATGASGDDILIGNEANNTLRGNSGNDALFGGAGNDTLIGGSGDDELYGGDGNDSIRDNSGDDVVFSGAGRDYVRVGSGANTFDGGSGSDYISYYDSPDGVTLDLQANTASGSWADDDTITGFERAAGSNNGGDDIRGTDGANTIRTYGGNDSVRDRGGDDRVELGDGNDYMRVGDGANILDGGAGSDYISYYDSVGGVTLDLAANTASGGWADDDTISGFERAAGSNTGDDDIRGTDGNNVIRTYAGNDSVRDREGNDTVELGSGNDYVLVGDGVDSFDGGTGKDYISYFHSTEGVTLDLQANIASGGWAEDDTINSFERASGSKVGDDLIRGTSGDNTIRTYGGDDQLSGRGGADILEGGNGNDFIWGGSGADVLNGGNGTDFLDGGGGAGTDTLYGGAGADRFHFDRGEGDDVVKDFENNVDTIEFDGFSYLTDAASALEYATTTGGGDTLFDFGSDGTLLVEGWSKGYLANDIDII